MPRRVDVLFVSWLYVSDDSVLGGLSLLLMAGQHVTASPLLTGTAAADTKPNNLLLNAATIGRPEAPPFHVSPALSVSVML